MTVSIAIARHAAGPGRRPRHAPTRRLPRRDRPALRRRAAVPRSPGGSTALRLEREPGSQRLDLRLDKRWQIGDWRLSTYLDIQNVYNYQAVEGLVYNYDFSQQAYQTGLPIIPSIGVRGEF